MWRDVAYGEPGGDRKICAERRYAKCGEDGPVPVRKTIRIDSRAMRLKPRRRGYNGTQSAFADFKRGRPRNSVRFHPTDVILMPVTPDFDVTRNGRPKDL
jgi:hypothetical protein